LKKSFKNLSILICAIILSLSIFSGVANATDIDTEGLGNEHFVLVHGGWHGSWSWYKVECALRALGYGVTTLDLPGHGADTTTPSAITLSDYQQKIVSVIDSINEKVILVGHGTSAPLVSIAAEVRPDKVKKIVYIAGVLVPNGKSLADVLTKDTQSMAVQNSTINGVNGTLDMNFDMVDKVIYGMSLQKDITLAKSLLKQEPLYPLMEPITITEENLGKIPSYYIKTMYDNALTASYQDTLLQEMPCDMIYSINSDHAPFFSKTTELLRILLEIANEDVMYTPRVQD
jgi:pimeloyl-ACP methyl ester carboxylesterase